MEVTQREEIECSPQCDRRQNKKYVRSEKGQNPEKVNDKKKRGTLREGDSKMNRLRNRRNSELNLQKIQQGHMGNIHLVGECTIRDG